MKKRGKKVAIDADLDEEVENYEPSESDDGFDDEERQMLNNAVGRRQNEEEREVLKIYSSSEDSDEEEADGDKDEGEEEDGSEKAEGGELYGGGVGSDMESDIEDKPKDDGLPDAKAWGSDRKQYYDTDYVDKDYLGFDDEEAAIEEEKEADAIQRRLLAHLEGTDFSLGLLDEVEDKKKEAAKKREEPEEPEEEKVEVDLSSLTHEEALDLLKRESPEMFPLLNHCKSQLLYLQEKIWPILKMFEDGTLKKCKAVELLQHVNKLTLHYTMNVLFYLYAKENGEPTDNHPVLKRFNAFRRLLQEVDVLVKQIDPQVDMLLDAKEKNEELVFKKVSEPPPNNRKEKRKRKFELLHIKQLAKKINIRKKRKLVKMQQIPGFIFDLQNNVGREEIKAQYEEVEEEPEVDEEEPEVIVGEEKRGVTFNILKNKGLTPKRKKENRNPRVKNRNKYKKAMKRRRGQVREPRKEINRYGGEISGVKSNISKSIKLK